MTCPLLFTISKIITDDRNFVYITAGLMQSDLLFCSEFSSEKKHSMLSFIGYMSLFNNHFNQITPFYRVPYQIWTSLFSLYRICMWCLLAPHVWLLILTYQLFGNDLHSLDSRRWIPVFAGQIWLFWSNWPSRIFFYCYWRHILA